MEGGSYSATSYTWFSEQSSVDQMGKYKGRTGLCSYTGNSVIYKSYTYHDHLRKPEVNEILGTFVKY